MNSFVSTKVTYKLNKPSKNRSLVTSSTFTFGAEKSAELWILIMAYNWELIKFYLDCFPEKIDETNEQIQKAAKELAGVYVEKKEAESCAPCK
jgi:hypothetical protein